MTAAALSPLVADRLSPLIGPFLTRVAGLDATVVDLVVPKVGELLTEVRVAEERLAGCAEPLIDVLFGLVPRLDDDVPLRRTVLAGKRAVNKRAALGWDTDTRQRLSARVPAGHAALIEEWDGLIISRAERQDELTNVLAAHRVAALDEFRRVLQDKGFLESLAIAAPDWIRYGKPHERGFDTPRDLQTLYSYITRASLKTSPFSGLTTVGVGGKRGTGRSGNRTSATVAYLALVRLARSETTAPLLDYRPALIREGGPNEPNGILVHSELVLAEGTVWRQDRVVEADHALRWIGGFAGRDRVSYAEVVEAIGGLRPFARFRRLLDSGVIRPVTPWLQGEAPLQVLAALVQGAESEIPAEDLTLAHDLGARSGEGGVAARAEVGARIAKVTENWASREEMSGNPSGLVYEDRETDLELPDPRSFPAVGEDLATLGAMIRPYLFRSHLYDFLLDRFVAEFGAGGSCASPLAFLMRQMVERDNNPGYDQATAADQRSKADPGARAWLPVGPTSAPPNVSVMFQIEADSHEAVLAGRHRLVVNNFGAGTGGMFARFRGLLGEEFSAGLSAHIERCWPGVPCRELVPWTDCNTAQAECAGILPPLLIPGEPNAVGASTLDEMVLVHDAGTNTLSLCDPAGDPFGLAYLGLVPQHLTQSYVRLLAVLADPWVNASPDCDYTLSKMPQLLAQAGADVVAIPRAEDGRIVTRRASWLVPLAAMPRPDSDDATFALRLREFRDQHGLPGEVFAHQLSFFPGAGARKPMWISLDSPLSMRIFHQWLESATKHVRLVEVLPGRESQPQRDDNGKRRVTEHITLLSWPRHDEGTR
ncbi:hypothetical protein [Amycolatopsis sp. NPDC059657]|uniref:hypothetical protein n=1 Tax=Amycolatopsis sp. NPDC059657 TaxID=3346899 RepID=UPI0036732350